MIVFGTLTLFQEKYSHIDILMHLYELLPLHELENTTQKWFTPERKIEKELFMKCLRKQDRKNRWIKMNSS